MRFSDVNFSNTPSNLPVAEKPDIEAIRALFPSAFAAPGDAYDLIAANGQSKTANVLFPTGLNRRLQEKHGILSLAVHPGAVGTELLRDMDPAVMQGVFESEQARTRCAEDSELE